MYYKIENSKSVYHNIYTIALYDRDNSYYGCKSFSGFFAKYQLKTYERVLQTFGIWPDKWC